MKKQVVQELMLNVIDTLIAIVNANIDNLDGETIARIAMICDTKRYPIETILSELNKEIQTHLLWAFGPLKFYFSFIFHLCFPFIIKFIFIQNLRIYYYEEVTKKIGDFTSPKKWRLGVPAFCLSQITIPDIITSVILFHQKCESPWYH